MTQNAAREVARRQHRTVALFAVLQCWIRGLDGRRVDGVCLQRCHFERLTGTRKFEESRKEWLKQDFRDLFPFCHLVGPKRTFSLFVSRVSLDPFPSDKDMSDEDRIVAIGKCGPRIEIFQLWKRLSAHYWTQLQKDHAALIPFVTEPGNADERTLMTYMTLAATGQVSVRRVIGKLTRPSEA